MKAEEKKSTRFAFFKKSKRLSYEPTDAGSKSENDDNSIKSGSSFSRRNRAFNPFKSVRKAVNKYRTTRTPAQEVVQAPSHPPTIVEPEPIGPEDVEKLQAEVSVVEDIRKNRAKGPQGRKRKSMRPSSTLSGSESGTPITAALDDLLKSEAESAAVVSHSENGGSGNTLSVATRTKSLNRPASTTEPPISEENHPPDLARSGVANLASSASDKPVEVNKNDKTEPDVLKDITVNGALCTSALGSDHSNGVGETF